MDSSIKFNVSANTAQFDSAMKRVGSVAQTTGNRVRSAFSGLGGLLAGGAIVAGLQSILRKMDDISDRAKRFGVTVEEIQKVGNAAEIVGTSFETVARAMDRTGVAANKAAREGGSVAEAFARVNLDPAAFAAATLQERVEMISKAQREANGDSAKMAQLFEVIGVRAAGINFAELSKEMGKVNAASADVVEQLADANDLLTKMQQNATIFGANLLKALVIDPAQRLGSLLGGEGFKTIQEVQDKYDRQRAADSLNARGGLLLDETGKPFEETGFTVNTKRNQENREKAKENTRRIDAELQRINEKKANAERVAQDAFNTATGDEDQVEPQKDQRRASTKNRLERRLQRLKSIYAGQVQMIHAMDQATPAQKGAMRAALDDQYMSAKQQAFEGMAADASIPEAVRQRAAEEARAPSGDQSTQADRATETTLQKVAKFLEELNTKLPQPVLV